MDVNKDLVKIILSELGKKTADLYVDFFDGFPEAEQVQGAREMLDQIVGQERTSELLKKFEKKNAKK